MALELYLVNGEETAITQEMKPICDGGGPLGHPREYLTLEAGGETVCKYCDRRYLHASHPEVAKVRESGEVFAS